MVQWCNGAVVSQWLVDCCDGSGCSDFNICISSYICWQWFPFEDWCKHHGDWKGCVWSRCGSLALQWQSDEVDGDAKRGCENGISHVWWHHRFLSVFSAWFAMSVVIHNIWYAISVICSYSNRYCVWMMQFWWFTAIFVALVKRTDGVSFYCTLWCLVSWSFSGKQVFLVKTDGFG